MLFNSPQFIFLFLPITLFLYFLSLRYRKITLSKAILISASWFFYGYWNPQFMWILALMILANYFFGIKIIQSNNKIFSPKIILLVGIIFNLSALSYFKYKNFFFENLNFFLDHKISFEKIILPLGISFITFQKIAFLVDCYQKKVKKPSFLDYALFVSFFPQLIAGPIVHHSEIIPQFKSLKTKFLNYSNLSLGIFIFTIGLFKKVVLADSLANFNSAGFSNPHELLSTQAWLVSLSYTFQIYFDFSGYTDMAIGSALLFNIKMPYNFNMPYCSKNISEFWSRWHMTLSRFLKDYIYIPIGGNRLGELRTYLNLMIVFLISGLWHGASWTFIFWGFLHGAATCINRLWTKLGRKMSAYLAVITTFLFINITWIFFRCENFYCATSFVEKLFFLDAKTSGINATLMTSVREFFKFNTYDFLIIFIIAAASFFLAPSVLSDAKNNCEKFKPTKKYLLIIIVLFSISMHYIYKPTSFIYFNF